MRWILFLGRLVGATAAAVIPASAPQASAALFERPGRATRSTPHIPVQIQECPFKADGRSTGRGNRPAPRRRGALVPGSGYLDR